MSAGPFFACFFSGSCGGAQSLAQRFIFAGIVCTYNAATCTVSRNQDAGFFQGSPPCPLSSGGSSGTYGYDCANPPFENPADSDIIDRSVTATVETITGRGICVSRPPFFLNETGNCISTLSSEDTEANAITRLLAGAGGNWGAWIISGAAGCNGVPPTCLLARWEQRTTGFSFIYQEAEWRIQQSGLIVGRTYFAQVYVYRSLFGIGSYSLFQTIVVAGVADGAGNLEIDGTVPNLAGYDSYAAVSSCVT